MFLNFYDLPKGFFSRIFFENQKSEEFSQFRPESWEFEDGLLVYDLFFDLFILDLVRDEVKTEIIRIDCPWIKRKYKITSS